MQTSSDLRHIPIIVLCGGQGTRLQSVISDKPKVLAPLGKNTFLDTLIDLLHASGFQRIILSVGYLKEQVREHCTKHKYEVLFSEEDEPLGTGGALKAARLLTSHDNEFFVMNGDTVCRPDFRAIYDFHRKMGGLMSMMIAPAYEGDGGDVALLDHTSRIVSWRKKMPSDAGKATFVNAGVYLMDKETDRFFPNRHAFSLERDVFPSLLVEPCYGYPIKEPLIDIGTPERYTLAQASFS